MTGETSSILSAAADLLEQNGWCQGAEARGPVGEETIRLDPRARSWCIVGSTGRAAWEMGLGLQQSARCDRFLAEVIGTQDITAWNDVHGRTKDEVIAALRTASERAAERAAERKVEP
jgi:hypothetical protein